MQSTGSDTAPEGQRDAAYANQIRRSHLAGRADTLRRRKAGSPSKNGAVGERLVQQNWRSVLDAEIQSAVVREGFRYWCEIRGNRELPRRADLDPIDIPKLLTSVTLIDVSYEPFDFRYRLLGGDIVRDQDVRVGESVRNLPTEYGRDIICERYRRSVVERRPVLQTYEAVTRRGQTVRIEALTCPLSDDARVVNMLVSFGTRVGVTPRPRSLWYA